MIEKLLPLLGKSIESEEIKALFTELGWVYPSKTTCTANNDKIKGKFDKDGVLLYFGRGANSRYLKPILAKTKGSYIGIFYMMEFTKKCKNELPFGLKYKMTPEELTAILGEPKVVNFMGTTTTWRKNYTDKHELIVSDSIIGDSDLLRSITLTFNYERDLYTMEEYEKTGF
jgi:hypothetical protein